MDDTQPSRVSDAAATRKRRSSILKSQRPARAPFSELELNVATPTDTAKSRRVSFSRRTGVAEFVTNEATTTWKNFYEEHNRTLESSGNDSEVKPPRPSVGHIGKRIFDQQFQEVEAVDFVSALDDGRSRNIENSMNNFAGQLEALECTSDDRKLPTPHQKFELSTFTDNQSKLFGDDLAITGMGELTDRISINFSAMQPLGGDNDDLDEIQRDLQEAQSNMCQGVVGPSDGRNISEYIEVDLNATNVAIGNYESDMSITETIPSPKVQELPKPNVSIDKKSNLGKDWVADKENIIMNPYVTPKESATFAINEEPDKVLVFDGKRLTIQTEQPPPSRIDFRKTLLPDVPPEQTPIRKTICLNVNDDLPNFDDEPYASMSQVSRGISMGNKMISADLSMTQPVPNKLETNIEKRRTIVYENDTGNISVTQGVPTNIVLSDKTCSNKRKTIVFDDDSADISVTQAILSNIILATNPELPRRRKTIVFEDDDGNLSITRGITSNIMIPNKDNAIPEKRRTIVFETDSGNISVTQAVPTNIIMPEKRNITVYDDDNKNDVSITSEEDKESSDRRKTIVFESDVGDISMTQAVPTNIFGQNIAEERRKTLVYEDDACNISITQAVPKNLILPETDSKNIKRQTIVFETDTGNISLTQALPSKLILPTKDLSRNNSIFQADFDLSVTDIVPTKLVQNSEMSDRRKTEVYEDDAGNISITQAIPLNKLHGENKRRTVVFETDSGNISVTQAVPSNIILENEINACTELRTSLASVSDSADVSITQGAPVNILMPDEFQHFKEEPSSAETLSGEILKKINVSEDEAFKIDKENVISVTEYTSQIRDDRDKRKTIVFDDDAANMSITKPIPVNIMAINNENNNEISKKDNEDVIKSETKLDIKQDIFVYQASMDNTNQLSILTEQGDTNIGPSNETIEKTFSKIDMDVDQSDTKMIEDKEETPLPTSEVTSEPDLDKIESDISKVDKKETPLPISEDTSEQGLDKIESDGSKVDKDEPPLPTSEVTSEPDLDKIESDISKADKKETPLPISEDTSEQGLDKIESDGSKVDKDEPPLPMSEDTSEQGLDKIESHEPKFEKKSKKSILSDLLDMSNASMDIEYSEDKYMMAVIASNNQFEENSPKRSPVSTVSSDSSAFLIVRDSEEQTQTDKNENNSRTALVLNQLEKQPLLPLEFKGDISIADITERDISRIRGERQSLSKNRHFESVVSSEKKTNEPRSPVSLKSFCDANNTNDLLRMLSNLTDKEEANDPLGSAKTDDDEASSTSSLEDRISFDLGKCNLWPKETTSISRQNSTIAHEIQEKSFETINTKNVSSGTKKCARMSPDVRKILQFEDESTSEASFRLESFKSPLKKTVFGESSYKQDNKDKSPIPSYLKDVSDGIKHLISDLVKPMAEVLPFDTGKVDKSVKKMSSTCSMQVQANLLASSQIDLDSDLHSRESIDRGSEVAETSNKTSTILKSSLKHPQTYQPEVEYRTESDYQEVQLRRPVDASVPGKVLVFDHSNPLNNVLLTPVDLDNAHPYDPIRFHQSLCPDPRRDNQREMNNQYYIESLLTAHPQAGDSCLGKISEVQSDASNMSKPLSIDQSIDALSPDVSNTEANTLIVMKENKELLEVSSSLTLVDNSMTNDKSVVLESSLEEPREQSPFEIIYQVEGEELSLNKLKSDVTLIDQCDLNTKKKRVRSPTKTDKDKNCTSNIDLTPKPMNKMQKLSNSPNVSGVRQAPNRPKTDSKCPKEIASSKTGESSNENVKNLRRSPIKSPRKTKESHKGKKPGTSITVQQLITEYHIENKINQEMLNDHNVEMLNDQIIEALKRKSDADRSSPEGVGSFTSSKNRNKMDDTSETTSESQESCTRRKVLPMDWQPELINELSSKNLAVECESGVNVVAKIDMLPFMGSRECEWESSSGDSWSFRLLHGRLRLKVRLSHRHDNATRTCVRADTPVLSTKIETTQQDQKNPVAVLCVNYAAGAMRHMSRGCTQAGDVPSLLRRAAGVARVALRWGRAMRDAWANLAYTLTNEGFLTLKVANIPLRSVWEVTMQIELAVDEEREVPWPRVSDVRVLGVVCDVPVCEAEVRRVLEHVRRDWGHAPRTIWTIFKYLKNKTRSDDVMLGALYTKLY